MQAQHEGGGDWASTSKPILLSLAPFPTRKDSYMLTPLKRELSTIRFDKKSRQLAESS